MTIVTKTVLTLASFLCFCVPVGFAADEGIVLGFVGGAKDNPVFQAARNGAEDEAAKRGEEKGVSVKVEWLAPSKELDLQQQVAMIEQLTKQGVSGIAVSPIDPKALMPAIEKAVYNGIPVVMFGSIVEMQKGTAAVGTDDVACGRMLMSALAKEIDDKGTVGILGGYPGSVIHQNRVSGAKEEASKHPNIRILGVFPCESPGEASQVILNVGRANPGLSGWAMVVAWAMLAQNAYAFYWQPGEIKVTSLDSFIDTELDYVRRGYVQVLLVQNFYQWGTKSVDLLCDKVIEHKDLPTAFVATDLIPVTRENAEQFAETWKKWLRE